jgi:hypothetical protein
MKKVIFVFAALVFIFSLVSCEPWFGDKRAPAVTPVITSISANSVTVKWKSVGKEFRYTIEIWKPDSQGWWVDNKQGYYILCTSGKCPENPQFLEEVLRESDGMGEMVDIVDETSETSVRFDNLEASTIYRVVVITGWDYGGLKYSDKDLFFRTKDE